MMLHARRNRFVFRPFHWVFLLLIIGGLWIGFLRIMLIIPTPADVDYEHTYFSPLPATVYVYFFRLNAPLLGWHAWLQEDKYTMSFANAGKFTVPEESCVSFSGMYLQIKPGSSFGSFVHWEVREIGICQ